ncbi:MAG: VacB/RNase II family 3'-5' exoribonuclease [Kiritimatiellia bacterium]|nr:VacB/RNase II family 3'-5' exoribonuclease [Kiritimatiellia bacterium]
MQRDVESEAVRYLLESDPERTWHIGAIAKTLGFKPTHQKRLRRILASLIDQGLIVEKRRDNYRFRPGANLISGTIRLLRSGAAIVTAPDHTTYFIEEGCTGNAFPGDTVDIRPTTNTKSASREPLARVVRITRPAENDIVATLRQSGRTCYAVPINPIYRTDFAIPEPGNAKDGDRVVVRLVQRMANGRNPVAKIIDVIGPADKPSLDTLAIMRQYGYSPTFPPPVLQEAETVSRYLQEPGPRLDLQDKLIITIDPERAKDFDDAISLEPLPDGKRRLGVHIADVSHFIRPRSALDSEAAKRATSVYFADRVIPMLPEQLSNGVCSLQPNAVRLTFSAFIDYDANGRAVARHFAKTIIRSAQRLTYEQALAILGGNQPEGIELAPGVAELLQSANTLAKQLRARREKNGGLELASQETEVVLDDTGRMVGIRPVPNDEAHQLIEAFMVAANEAVATELTVKGIHILARLHEPPDPEKLEELYPKLDALGLKHGDLSNPKNLAAFLKQTAEHPLRHTIHTAVLRSLKRAVYSSEAHGHFGLALKYYSHFTSPIRRYPDLVLHRQLADYLASNGKGGRLPDNYLKLAAINASECEMVADEASRALLEIKKFRFLQQQLDDQRPLPYEAVIVAVKKFGIFVDILDLQISGMVHTSAFAGRHLRYNEYQETLSDGQTTYCVGQSLRVQVERVDFDARRADFRPVFKASPPSSKRTKSSRQR